MKTLLILAALLGSTVSFAEQNISPVGDKIIFQKDSAYVSALYSKSLCKNGDQYEAMITKCVAWGQGSRDGDCLETAKFFATQPVVSTAQRCAEFTGHDDNNCARWETYPLVQSPVRNVKFVNDSGTVIKSVTVTIPACSASK